MGSEEGGREREEGAGDMIIPCEEILLARRAMEELVDLAANRGKGPPPTNEEEAQVFACSARYLKARVDVALGQIERGEWGIASVVWKSIWETVEQNSVWLVQGAVHRGQSEHCDHGSFSHNAPRQSDIDKAEILCGYRLGEG